MSLIPNPLHPAVVHLPVAIAVLVPIVAIGALIFIKRGTRPGVAWGLTVASLSALLLSGWVALQTGEQQEERVEDVVGDAPIHTHEEAAELFLMTTGVVLAVGLAGFAPGRVGRAGRWAATLGTAAILGTGWNVGHTGGMLVYRDGAATAYTGNASMRSDAGEQPRRSDVDSRRERRDR